MRVVYLLRHEQSRENVLHANYLPIGIRDSALTEYGRKRALDTGKYLDQTMEGHIRRELKTSRVFCSSLGRTRDTVNAMRHGGFDISSDIHPTPDLDEVGMLTSTSIGAQGILRTLDGIAANCPTVLLVGHGLMFRCFLKYLGVFDRLSIPTFDTTYPILSNHIMANGALIRLVLSQQYKVHTIDTIYTPNAPRTLAYTPPHQQQQLAFHQYLIGYSMIHASMCKLIDEATTVVYLVCFEFEPNYRGGSGMMLALNKALRRGVEVFLQTSRLNPSCSRVDYTPLYKLRDQFPAKLHLQLNYARKGDNHTSAPYGNLVKMILNTASVKICNTPPNCAFNGIHYKFLCTDKSLLLGGVNYSHVYSENPMQETSWYDSAIQWNAISTQCVNMMSTVWHDRPHESTVCLGTDRFVFHNHKLYEIVMENISKARDTIYMEQQYFFSDGGNLYNNKIADAIVHRISRAYHAKRPFHVSIITNNQFPHEDTAIRTVFMSVHQVTLQSLLTRVCTIVGADVVDNYLTIKYPESPKITIHTKVFIFDQERIILTSGNIIDSSFADLGYGELSWICENNPFVFNKVYKTIIQSTQNMNLVTLRSTRGYKINAVIQKSIAPHTNIDAYMTQLTNMTMPLPNIQLG
jgi:phosphatidylserine/phosphatidylglycerophosphate/cardiolipin synthase-like enzyme/phosphohistidine phosphatase SixA